MKGGKGPKLPAPARTNGSLPKMSSLPRLTGAVGNLEQTAMNHSAQAKTMEPESSQFTGKSPPQNSLGDGKHAELGSNYNNSENTSGTVSSY